MCPIVMATNLRAFDGVAVLGDSSSTGAAANPALEFDSELLWQIFEGTRHLEVKPEFFPRTLKLVSSDEKGPTRVGPSVRENDAGSGWLWQNLIQTVASRTVEEHRLSYGYFLGRSLGIEPQNILLAGENGATTRRAWIHASRLLSARNRDLPSRIILFYTGNDLCAQSFDLITSAEDYGASLLKAMKYLVVNGHVAARGTKIYLPAFLPVTALLHEPSIVNQKIRVHGQEMTCREAREKLFAPAANRYPNKEATLFQIFKDFIPPSPVLLCPTLFSPQAQDSARQSLLANRIRAYREAQQRAVEDFNEWRGRKHPAKAFEAIYLAGTEQIKFGGGDVAGDCFHLSANGQAKVAEAILKDLK